MPAGVDSEHASAELKNIQWDTNDGVPSFIVEDSSMIPMELIVDSVTNDAPDTIVMASLMDNKDQNVNKKREEEEVQEKEFPDQSVISQIVRSVVTMASTSIGIREARKPTIYSRDIFPTGSMCSYKSSTT